MTQISEELVERAFALLNAKYVQRADARQQSMGLQYTEAETHDLARLMARFADQVISELGK
jgi:hypothetical protein